MNHMDSFPTLLTSRAGLRLLRLFLETPTQAFSGAEAQRRSRLSKAATLHWLRRWERYGLLARTTSGRAFLYQLNRSHPVVKQLKRLFTVALIAEAAGKAVGEVYLYGSAARGEDVEQSDLDLLIISKRDHAALRLVERVQKKSRHPVKPLFLTPLEYAALAKSDPALYMNLERERVRVI